MAATVDESTPPDMATAMVFGSGIRLRASGFLASIQLSAISVQKIDARAAAES
jgi:hypothetical protein